MDNDAILVQKALNKKASIAANSLLKVNSYLNKIDSALEGVCELDTQSRSGDVIAKLALHRILKMNSHLFEVWRKFLLEDLDIVDKIISNNPVLTVNDYEEIKKLDPCYFDNVLKVHDVVIKDKE